uniref:Uncharacterized protein n=1 Tax=Meloidogyne enterolobii TaxID=390850 RepID=A0A6V7TWU1_MELEN|nr:unnamed protein product [Meloidogyne enterolobii]
MVDLQPCVRGHFCVRDWVFQQNSSPDNKAKDVYSCCAVHLKGFILPQLFLPYTSGLKS